MDNKLIGIKKPRPVTFRGVTYKSLNAFARWARSQGYEVKFSNIRLALNLGRDLEDVILGKKFARKIKGPPVVYQGTTYSSASELFKALYKKRKRVYLTKAGFCNRLKRAGVEDAVDGLLHKHITRAYISRRLGGNNNLILVRIKNGWDPKRAMNERCGAWRTKGKKHE